VIVLDRSSKLIVIIITLILINTPQLTYTEENLVTSNSTIVVRDALDREVEIQTPVTRIVSLAPSITEILFALNKQDLIVGVDAISYDDPHYGIADYVREKGIRNVGGYWWSLISIEAILELEPDLVLADKGAHLPLLNTFEELGLKTIYLHSGSARELAEVYKDIELVGLILNCTLEASQLILNISREFEYYSEYLKNNMYPVKYLFIIYIDGGVWVAGRSTYIDDALNRLGLTNTVDMNGWVLLSIEDLYRLSPDVIMITTMVESDIVNIEKLVDTYGLYRITSKIIILKPMESDYFLRPGPLVKNIPRTIYSILESYGFRKPPPLSESKSIPVINLVLILIATALFLVKRR